MHLLRKRPRMMSMFGHRYATVNTAASKSPSGTSRPDLRLSTGSGWLPSGWHGMAYVNIAVLVVIILLLGGLLIAATLATGGGLTQSWQIRTADCRTTATINTSLHLVINILSTLILASSNFFMQVLNAPTRHEIDHAHGEGRWLDIGVPSWRNAFWLSTSKRVACVFLLLTSMPIHLIFNSTIFKMDHRMGDFHATIASSSFVDGGSYYLPGASLVTNELFDNQNARNQSATPLRTYDSGFGNSSLLPTFSDLLVSDYSAHASNVSNAADRASGWKRLEAAVCKEVFQEGTCTGLKEYRNVVMIVGGRGWRRSELWNISTAADGLWEPIVPRDGLNSLWYSAQCDMTGVVEGGTWPGCLNTCDSLFSTLLFTDIPFPIDFQRWYPADKKDPSWNASLYSAPGNDSDFGFLLNSFNINYCLVEPRETTCTVAISKPLLLAVILSTTLKLIVCVAVVRLLGSQEPIVTLGDAISSFISIPPQQKFASGLITDRTVRDRSRKKLISKPVVPIRWSKQPHRRAGSVSPRAWFRFYSIHAVSLIAVFLIFARQASNIPLESTSMGSYEAAGAIPRIGSASSYFTTALVANIPQIWLSFCYYVYNALITRLEMSWEWNQFSVKYCPLRVTKPQGQQISTHRLQLPYKFSIPSMIFSILTHWLLSNSLFVVISQGSYYRVGHGDGDYTGDPPSLPEDAAITLSASRGASLAFILFSIVSLLLPLAISAQKLPGQMPVVGSNSLAIAAACRVSPLARTYGDFRRDHDMQTTCAVAADEPFQASSRDAEQGLETRQDLALYRLKWGEVSMPDGWYLPGLRVGHLGFGSVFDDPQPPTDGRLYR